jgi:LysR family glycine cleavage system transcriptional activator
MIQAALDGQGLALMAESLAAADLAAGRLVTPFDLSVAEGYGYYLVVEPGALARPKVAAFRDFLLEEAAGPPARVRSAPALPPASRRR